MSNYLKTINKSFFTICDASKKLTMRIHTY